MTIKQKIIKKNNNKKKEKRKKKKNRKEKKQIPPPPFHTINKTPSTLFTQRIIDFIARIKSKKIHQKDVMHLQCCITDLTSRV